MGHCWRERAGPLTVARAAAVAAPRATLPRPPPAPPVRPPTRAADGDGKDAGTVGEVVAAVGEGGLVGAHAADQGGHVGEGRAALVVGAAAEGHHVVPPVLQGGRVGGRGVG